MAPEQLRSEQERTLTTSRRRYGPAAQGLSVALLLIYGRLDYNLNRPHSALNQQTPDQFNQTWNLNTKPNWHSRWTD